MAEAHSAVAFSFSVTHDGLNVHVSQDALKSVYFSGVRSWRKRKGRFFNRFHSRVYPAKFSSLSLLFFPILLASYFDYDLSYGLYDKVHQLIFSETSFLSWVFACFLTSSLIWIMGVLFIRYLLKLILSYRGFMFEPHGKISLTTRVWFVVTKILGGRNPKLYSYQSSLPTLPVPSLNDTIKRYLLSVRPILNDEAYAEVVKLSDEFLGSIAARLQRYLVLKSWWSSNYVTDWWEKYVYLSGREPIMVNSNYYGMDMFYLVPTNRQVSRAAIVVHSMFAFRSSLDREAVKPIMIRNVVPLCSAQFKRLFNSCRIPGITTDTIKHWNDSRHIAVYHQGRWFKVFCYKNGQLLKPKDLEKVFEAIIMDTSMPSKGEEQLAALTAGARVPWAEARKKFFSNGVNKKSLHAIEKAAFVLVLDDDEFDVRADNRPGISAYGRSLLHGNCHNRWFDKTFNLIVYKNGRYGLNAEHSWADAPILSYLIEDSLGFEVNEVAYDKEGKVASAAKFRPIPHERLNWSIPEECLEVIESSLKVARNLASDVDLQVMPFSHFGKGLMKTYKMSPDAFIQSALQLAHLRDKGNFALTYEASMTRLFREGRTETVRSCTNEIVAFARSMDDPNATAEERYALLMAAAQRHVNLYKEAMVGMGIDRHLFCLYVVSKYLKLESPFLQKVLSDKWCLSTSQTAMEQAGKLNDNKGMVSLGGGFGPVLSEPWRLSTSQTPHQQKMAFDLKLNPTYVSGGGGFGPVADDGYGVSYIICYQDLIMFHISSKSSSKETDSDRFAKNIEKAMLDMRDMCEEIKKKK